MYMKNKIVRIMAISTISAISILATSGIVNAETITANASITVQNGFTITETTPLSFGTIVAIANSHTTADLATLVVSSDGVSADIASHGTLASIVSISPGAPGVFTVTGAAPNTVLTVTPASAFTLSDPSGTFATDFDVNTFTQTVVTSGTPFTYDTDGTGTLVFNYGATLSTKTPSGGGGADVAVPYDNITFTGTYSMQIEY